MSNKVHIALLGQQTMPVYLGILNSDADEFIIVHSKQTEELANRIQNEIRNYKSGVCSFQNREFPAVDYTAVYDEAKSMVDAEDKEFEVNLSGGTKTWTIAFTQLSGIKNNVSIWYIDQNCIRYDCVSGEKVQLELPCGIKELLAYNNQYSYRKTQFSEYTSEDLKACNTIESAWSFNQIAFNSVTLITKDKQQLFNQDVGTVTHNSAKGDALMSWDKVYGAVEIVLPSWSGKKTKVFKVNAPHAFHLATNAGWLECKVADILNKWTRTKEIWMNVIFPYKSEESKNEIDIILSAEGKLLFVECKIKVFERTDIDKFSSAVRNYGGMGSKAIFVSYDRIDSKVKEKCETNGIMYFSLERGRAPVEQLYEYLESNLANMNTR